MASLHEWAADWSDLEPLLDEALALPAAHRPAWLAQRTDLPPARRSLLHRLLGAPAPPACPESPRPLAHTLPRLPLGAAGHGAGQPASGDTVGPWRLMELLGEGGMGSVWLAERRDGNLRRRVALKLPRLTWTPGLHRRFAAERDILAQLDHPHIARLYDAGVDELGRPWMALEHVPGLPIDVHCRTRNVGLRDRVALLVQACRAMAYAHSRLVVHRDIKPQHLMVTLPDDAAGGPQVRVLDFGIGKLLHSEDEEGLTEWAGIGLTPGYASPEQLRGDRPGTATDVFSLGCVAYELLSGRPPFPFSPRTVAAYERALREQPLLPASRGVADRDTARRLRGDLDAVLDQALQRDPGRRYAHAQALADDLQAWLDGRPVAARHLGRRALAWRWVRRHRWGVAAAGAAVAVLGAATVISLTQALNARDEARRAAEQAELARRQARNAQASQELLRDIFRLNSIDQRDPLAAQQTTVRALLDMAARSAPERLRDAPDVHIALLETLSSLYAQLGAFDQASAMARRRVEEARRALPPDDPRRAEAFLALAARLHDTPERATARALIDEAAAVVARAGPAAEHVQGALALQRANHERWGSLEVGVREAERAVVWFREHQPSSGLRISALYTASVLQAMAGEPMRAIGYLDEARQMSQALGEGGTRALLAATAERGELLEALGRWSQADAAHDEAVAIGQRTQGDDHPSTLVLRIQRARWWVNSGRVAQGDAEWAQIQARIAARQPPLNAWWVAYAQDLFDRSALSRGEAQRLEPRIRAAVDRVAQTVPQSLVTAQRRLRLVQVLIALDRDDEAWHELDEAERTLSSAIAGLPDRGIERPWRLERARLLLRRGDAAAALPRVQALQSPAATAEGATDRVEVERLTLLAQVLRALDQPGQALAATDDALAMLRHIPAPYRFCHEEARLLAERADILDALGRAGAARAARAEAIRLRQVHDRPGSAELAALLARQGAARGNQRPRAAD